MSLVSLYILKGFSIDAFESGNFSFSFLSILCIQSKRASKLNTCILDMLSLNQGSNFFPFLHHLQAAWSVITELWKCFARREEEKRGRENGSHSSFSPQSPPLFPSFSPTVFDLCYTQARISWRLLQKQKLYILKGFSIDGFESGNFSFSFLSILYIQSKRASKLNTCILDMLSLNQGSNFFPFLHHLQAAWSVIREVFRSFCRPMYQST